MPENQNPDQPASGDATSADENLGASGLAALQKEREARAEAERQLRALKRERDDLRKEAEGAKTVEQQLAELTARHNELQRAALASRIAAEHGLTPQQADLFLTGQDAESLTQQAQALAQMRAEAAPVSSTPKPDLTQGSHGSASMTPEQLFIASTSQF